MPPHRWLLLSAFCLRFRCDSAEGVEDVYAVRPMQFAPWSDEIAEKFGCNRDLDAQDVSAVPPPLPEKLVGLLKQSARHGIVLYSVFWAKDAGDNPDDVDHIQRFDARGTAPSSWLARMVAQDIRPVVIVNSKKWAKIYAKMGVLVFQDKEYLKKLNRFVHGQLDELNLFRWTVAEQIVRAGLDGMYFDLDTIWFGDLREAYADSGGVADIVFQSQVAIPADEGDFPNSPPVHSWRRHAKREGEHICGQIDFSAACTGVMIFRATPEVQRLCARVRARTIAGPFENMKASIMELVFSCAPRGKLRCGLFTHRGLMGWPAFELFLRKANEVFAKSEAGGCGMKATGRPCPADYLRQHGPLMLHLDAEHDKSKATATVNDLWPPPLPLADTGQAEAHAVAGEASVEL